MSNYIASLLETGRFRDYAPNGIQVEGRPEVLRIATGVTASQQVLEEAAAWGADALLVHHGYFWRGDEPVIVGFRKRRIAHLLQRDMSLLAYHLPLDAHPDLGNNAQLAGRLGFAIQGRFGAQDIGMHGVLFEPKPLGALAEHVVEQLQHVPQVIGDADRPIRRIAWCSGAAQSSFEQAAALGVDAYLTGEISEFCVHVARETGVAFIAAGHHATERHGIQALGEHLAAQFGLAHQFFDQDIPV